MRNIGDTTGLSGENTVIAMAVHLKHRKIQYAMQSYFPLVRIRRPASADAARVAAAAAAPLSLQGTARAAAAAELSG